MLIAAVRATEIPVLGDRGYLKRLQSFLHKLFYCRLGLCIANGANGLVRFSLFVAEGNQREHGVVDMLFLGRKSLARGSGFPRSGDADFVAQLNDDSFGSFFANTLDSAETRDVARHDQTAKHHGRNAVKNGQGKLWANAADVIDEKKKEIALLGRCETVEYMSILANLEMCEDFGLCTWLGKLVVSRERDVDVVANAARLNNEAHGQNFDHGAAQKGNHSVN